MQFIKVRDVKSPVRLVGENAGIDFYIPENTESFVKSLLEKNNITISPSSDITESFLQVRLDNFMDVKNGVIWIAPHKDIIIPSGIKSKFAANLALIANNKSGIATKRKLIFGASVIDASYQGEWHFHLINTSDAWQTVECGMKVIQFIPHLISQDPVEIVDMTEEEFFTESTSRGEGWAGSTGLN